MNRLKDEMIQNISHEFRTPLQYFRGYVSLMLDDRERLDPEHYEFLTVLDQQADRLRWLVNNFISLENLHQKRNNFLPVDLNFVLSSAVHGAQAISHSRSVSVTYSQTEHLPPVHGHLGRLCQVVDNLLSNALKFTPEGGTIDVWGELSKNREDILIHVQDSGIGIDPADQERIFDRFYQVDGTSSRQQGGVGIGLAVCKSIIEQHHGNIRVESTAGRGSQFTISLPVMQDEEIQAYK